VYDWQKDVLTRLVSGEVGAPAWTPNGKSIFFRTFSSTGSSISVVPSDGSAEPQRVLEGKNLFAPYSVSPDSRYLAYFERSPETYDDIWILPLDTRDPDHPKRSGDPWPFRRTKWTEREPKFSPDGRWIAYSSNESGMQQIWVRPFRPGTSEAGPGRQISVEGGANVVWSPKNNELFYTARNTNILMVVNYTVDGAAFIPAKPRVWSMLPLTFTGGGAPYDVAPDGKRLAILPAPAAGNARLQVTLLQNFFDELRRRVRE
jgi:serine/threonine-protein kinase